jgi:hypothetical protein
VLARADRGGERESPPVVIKKRPAARGGGCGLGEADGSAEVPLARPRPLRGRGGMGEGRENSRR